jgi:Ubiquinol-cytochrome C reductase complex 14kD subunit
VAEALRRLPQEEVDARNQRLKRASDVSLKKRYLPKELQAVQTPYNFYISASPLQPSQSTRIYVQSHPGSMAWYVLGIRHFKTALLFCYAPDCIGHFLVCNARLISHGWDVDASCMPFPSFVADALSLSIAQPTLDLVEAENAEKFLLGTGKSYDRQIP